MPPFPLPKSKDGAEQGLSGAHGGLSPEVAFPRRWKELESPAAGLRTDGEELEGQREARRG